MVPGIVDPSLLAPFVGFWLVIAVAWTPFLAARSVRRLFEDRPTARLDTVRDGTPLPNTVRTEYDVHRSP
jgi:hypothetical protein